MLDTFYYMLPTYIAKIAILVFVCGGLYALYTASCNKRYEAVAAKSRRYVYLYDAYRNSHLDRVNMQESYTFHCSSLKQFKDTDYHKRMRDYLRTYNRSDLIQVSQAFFAYEQSLINAPKYLTAEELHEIDARLNYKRFHQIEVDMCKPYEMQRGAWRFKLFVDYRSPGGRNYYRNHAEFDLDAVMFLMGHMQKNTQKVVIKPKAAHKSDTPVTISPGQRQRILRRDNFTCRVCGNKGPGAGGNAMLRVDHRRTFNGIGKDSDDNLWTLCQNCGHGTSA